MDAEADHPLALLLGVGKQNAPPWSPGPDPRSAQLPLIGQAWVLIVLVAAYLLAVAIGPRLMEKRQAWNVNHAMQIYNCGMTLLSLYMAVELPMSGFSNNQAVSCAPIGHDLAPSDYRVARVIWLYFFSKIIEFADTIFMIVRKKNSQVTFLHVYHHASIAIVWWVVARWMPGGSSSYEPVLNCVVHVFMYAYYFLASLGDWIKPYLWWKCYLTQLQMVQFATLILHSGLIAALNCGYPRNFAIFVMLYMLSFLLLFYSFYNKCYSSCQSRHLVSAPTAARSTDNSYKNK
eukprot:scpid76693/ scgid23573/ Elongation of very long chain fatty acids protein 4; 3-keto acyl-CoA synthase Elovl4; ELOVL fatty acid elongase 4